MYITLEFSDTKTIFIEEKKLEQIFIYLKKHGNENKFLHNIKKTAAASQQDLEDKNYYTTESRDTEILSDNLQLPSLPTEFASPLTSDYQISLDIISSQNTIETKQPKKNNTLSDIKIENFKLEKEKEKEKEKFIK